MIPLTTLHLAHLPPDLAVHIALCRELQNAAFLRAQLLAGNAEFEYALLDAGSVGVVFSSSSSSSSFFSFLLQAAVWWFVCVVDFCGVSGWFGRADLVGGPPCG